MSAQFPRPPDKPQDYECCQRGCCPCIFDYYYDALERWETRVRALGGDPKALFPSLDGEGQAAEPPG